jgi:hypothetical protein
LTFDTETTTDAQVGLSSWCRGGKPLGEIGVPLRFEP